MRPRTLRSGLITVALLTFAVAAWVYLAPTAVGGSTSYVVTSGTSMQPRFHTGDLALVRPANRYLVGEIVAYRSTALHEVVLHRIVSRDGSRYLFKGDNNNFLDPTRPTRAELVGALWLHVPHAGLLLKWLHTPIGAAAVVAMLAPLLLFGAEETRRRRKRRGANGSGRQKSSSMNTGAHRVTQSITSGALVIASAVAAAAFFVLGLIAFVHPADRPSTVGTPYTQQVTFGYGARVPAGLIYPNGVLTTGDPIFLSLVHQLRVGIDYRLATAAPHNVSGAEQVLLRINGPGGWSRSIPMVALRRFTGDHVSAQVILDLPRLQSLLARVGALTGVPGDGGYTLAVAPQVYISGTVAGRPIKTTYKPSLAFVLGPTQLNVGGGSATSGTPAAASSTSSGASQANFAPTQTGSVATAATAASYLGVAGATLSVTALRWIALVGFLLSALTAEVAHRLKGSQPFEETARIQAKYGHLIVPIVATTDALSWAPYEVPNIKALVQLAESGQRLILHHRDEQGDTYLVNEESTVYRYRVKDNRVRWDEWTAPPAEVEAIASQLASAAGDHPPTGQPLPHPDRGEQAEPGGQAHGVGDPGEVGTA